ncbi:MAG: 2Fe-2S iron-sulfur cluster binding domain-containing protein [Acidobacteriia bacterium]|nr:2Fe-2S iron-sulfur cluster binding domain-containing protein [Terriglobia bacterium]
MLDTPDGRHAIDCGEDEFIWNAAARAGIRLPAICHQGRCLTCAARLVEGDFDQSAANSYFAVDRDSGFVLLCTARPRSDLVLETHQQWIMREHRRALGLPAPYA